MQFFLAVIADVKAFQKAVKLAAESALNDNLVTFGIVTTFPATGYGYVVSVNTNPINKFS